MLTVPSLNEIEAELCRRSFYYFVQQFWSTIIAEKPVWNWHIPYLCDELQRIGMQVALLDRRIEGAKEADLRRLTKDFDYEIINVPPGSSKSTIVSVMFPLWCWTVDPTMRFICGSYASTPAEDLADKSFKIYCSEKFAGYFPNLVKDASGGKTNFKNGLLGERYTTSTGSSITGIHAHIILLDDPMNPQIAVSETERKNANKWVAETLSTRKVDEDITATLVIMQRLHEDDTTGNLLAKKGLRINHICLPIEASKNVKPAKLLDMYVDGVFDPIRKPRSSFATIKENLGSYGYAGQMEQLPSPADGGILKKAWFPIVGIESLPPNLVAKFQLDTAYTDKQKNDPSAGTAYMTDGNFVYILNSISVYKEFPELCAWIPIWVNQYHYSDQSRIYVEPKASGKSTVQQVKQTTKLNIIEDEAPDKDKVTRANAASPKCEAGRVILILGSWNESFLNQVASFPNGAHDDEVDNLSAIVNRELNTPKNPFAMW